MGICLWPNQTSKGCEVTKPVVQLWDYEGAGLIIPAPTGIVWSNQTGGMACHHPELEGYFLPVRVSESLFSDWCCTTDGFAKATWDGLSVAVGRALGPCWQFDTTRAADGQEAWIPVYSTHKDRCHCWMSEDQKLGDSTRPIDGRGAILTYENCD